MPKAHKFTTNQGNLTTILIGNGIVITIIIVIIVRSPIIFFKR